MSRAYHHGDLEKAVIQTATLLLESDGIEGISLRKIAKEIGVSHQAPYRHFESREHVLAALRAEGFQALAEASQNAQRKHPKSARLQLESTGEAYVKQALSRPALYQLMFGGSWKFNQLQEQHQSCAGVAFKSLASIVQQGHPPHTKKTIERTRILWATLHGLVSLQLNGFLKDQKDQLDTLVRSAVRSLSAEWYG